ncbi:type I polyketide synthase [Actinoplanes sp. M2I2]|uniref:type I polyketide synthase n=1 Tax=Actinoplanes sp. M2I2 TaxID=1734444 RepID=UPI00202080B6|nr:type I polyketide synthase [Actinoplanes sp. M2I2]
MAVTAEADEDLQNAVAVIGLAARIPGVADLDEFWAALVAGRDLTTRSGTGRRYGLIAGSDRFDAAFFGIAPSDAQVLDPQNRVFLECAWEALEQAGYDPGTYSGAIGVYAGSGETDHFAVLRAQRHRFPGKSEEQLRLAASRDFLTGRVAYQLNLRGPAVTVHTGCSTSLVAVHLACQALLGGETDLALAGGVTLRGAAGAEEADDLLSPDGHCRPFDADADGMVGADGAGVVVLKRLSDALADSDHIDAVILGSGLSNDGSGKVSFTAPSVSGQVAAARSAYLLAGVEPDTVAYVEAHGTGTAIGDTIEVRALSEAFGPGTPQRCLLGSVKSNIGHADAAAGVLGLIKVVLSLRHGVLPGTAHFRSPNPHLDLPATPFRVTSDATPWPRSEQPRRAGINSTGIGGTNAHLVVEEAPVGHLSSGDDRHHLLPLSARTARALAESAARLSARLRRDPVALADVAWTLQSGRAEFAHRAFVVCRDRDEAVRALTELAGRPQAAVTPATDTPQVAFLFPGPDGLPVGVTRELYRQEPVFRAVLDDCADRAAADLGLDLRTVLCPEAGHEAEAQARLATPAVAEPALFAVQRALAELWESRGVGPHAVLGYGSGGYAAAVSAGVLTGAGALSLVLTRARILSRSPRADAPLFTGEMLEEYAEAVAAVRLSPPRVPWVCDRTGAPVTAQEAGDPAFWVRRLRQPVRFSDALRTLLDSSAGILLEVGPGDSLGRLARQHPGYGSGRTTLRSLPDAAGHAESLRSTGALWQAGLPVRWAALHSGRSPRRVPLPAYPFQRERFAVDEPTPGTPASPDGAGASDTDPRTATEKTIAEVWCEVLRVPRVGVDDDFFEIGGHSLQATRVITRLGSALGPDIPPLTIMDLFDHSTIRELAALVSGPDVPTSEEAP